MNSIDTPLFRAHRAAAQTRFLQLLKAHASHGFALIKNDTSGFKSEDDYVDYLIELMRAGLEQRTQYAVSAIEATPRFDGLVDLQIGWDAETGAVAEFNRRTNGYLAAGGQARRREDAVC